MFTPLCLQLATGEQKQHIYFTCPTSVDVKKVTILEYVQELGGRVTASNKPTILLLLRNAVMSLDNIQEQWLVKEKGMSTQTNTAHLLVQVKYIVEPYY